MRRSVIGWLLAGCASSVQASGDCGAMQAPALPVQSTLVAPLSPELVAPSHPLGAPTGVLAQALDESLAVDNVLLRRRLAECLATANATPSANALPDRGAAYQPQTAYDNTPWRFDMSQNGKRMTADEFDAWMKARGVRVVKKPATATPSVTAESAQPEAKK